MWKGMLPQRYGVFQRALGQSASPYFVASGPATLVAVRAEGRSREARAEWIWRSKLTQCPLEHSVTLW